MKPELKKFHQHLGRIWRIALTVLAVAFLYFYVDFSVTPSPMQWGVTFSQTYAQTLGLNWREVYLAVLNDLKVDHIRLVAYWPSVEPRISQYNFQDLDFQVQEASVRHVQIILAVGRRLPRWPECHIPDWAKSETETQQATDLLNYVGRVITRYKDNPNIVMWQVENEFFLRRFGECPVADSKLLDRELALVRSLDRRPILLTDSGELGGWLGSVRRADVFGTTMYRIIRNPRFGYATYPIRPIYYLHRFWLYAPFFRAKTIVNVELQAEPWAETTLTQDSLATQYRSLSPEQFDRNIQYARASRLSPAYLWGAEWWYYLKVVKGIPTIWDKAKKLWSA